MNRHYYSSKTILHLEIKNIQQEKLMPVFLYSEPCLWAVSVILILGSQAAVGISSGDPNYLQVSF